MLQTKVLRIIALVFFGLLIVLFHSCANSIQIPAKIETVSEGEIDVNGEVDVNQNINFDLSTFREVCEAEYADEVNEQTKEQLIADCQQERLEEFLDLLASLADEAEEGAESE